MKKTFNVVDELFKEAKAACGATTDTATVRLGLEALRHAAYERLRTLRGTEPHAATCPGVGKGRRPNEGFADGPGGHSVWIRFLVGPGAVK
jgi:hypothetical protein